MSSSIASVQSVSTSRTAAPAIRGSFDETRRLVLGVPMAHTGMAGPSVGGVRLKRTRPIRGKYFHTTPRVMHTCPNCGWKEAISIKTKVSQAILETHGPGEIERGRVDGDE